VKCLIVYLSLTGNTEKVALSIQKGIQQVSGHCDIVKLREANPGVLNQYDLIGLGSPVIGIETIGTEPPNVKAFINNFHFVGGKHAFAFCTHGTHYEMFFPRVIRYLKLRGMVVIGSRDWYGTVYIPAMPKPYPTDGHPDAIDLKEAEEFGKEMAERSQRITSGEKGLIPPVPKLPIPTEPPKKEGESSFSDRIFSETVKYYPEKCKYPRCQLCMDNCPVYGIDLTIQPPGIAKPCINCEFCAEICPTGALDGFEFNDFAARILARDIKELLLSDLARTAADGHYRPPVRLDKVGTGLPLYKSHLKHPRWIIGKGLA
jgi:flavodoxin/NAD-dependent dihydropyrimidine dehydrogenase PreA subunit